MKNGKFGKYGGKFVPETLMHVINELETNYMEIKQEKKFTDELNNLLHLYAGRPTPIYHAKNLTEKYGGAKIYFKREDLLIMLDLNCYLFYELLYDLIHLF